MAAKFKFSFNGSVVNLNSNFVEQFSSYVWEEFKNDPEIQQRFLSRLERISRESKEEYQNTKGARAPGTKGVLEDEDQDCDATKASRQKPSTPAASEASRLFSLGKEIVSENCKNSGINVAVQVVSYILEAMMATPQGKERILSCLQRISKTKYLKPKGTTIPKGEMVLEDKAHNCDTTKASCREPPNYTSPASRTRKMLNPNNCSDSIKGIIVRELVYWPDWKKIMNTPQGEKGFLTCLLRISREAKEEYLNMKAANSPKPEGLLEDKIQDCDTKDSNHAASASSTSRKSKASFEQVCEALLPGYKLPEGLPLAQSIYCAKAALAFYNNKHGTEYKLVEPLSSARHLDCGVRFHSNFTAAKLKKNGSLTSQPKLFYADFRCFKTKVSKMHCCIIDAAKATFMCCGEYCPPDIAHCDKRSSRNLPCYDRYISPTELKAMRNEFCAKKALDFYNSKHGTTYELVKSLDSNIVPVSFGIYKFSCNFMAKLENPGSSSDVSPKHLFGELVYSDRSMDYTGDCRILNTAEGLDDHT